MFHRIRNPGCSAAASADDDVQDARDAEELWCLIRAPEEVRAAKITQSAFARRAAKHSAGRSAGRSDGARREMAEMSEISQCLHAQWNDPAEKARLEVGAQDAFTPTHNLLMSAIERDTVARRHDVPARLAWWPKPLPFGRSLLMRWALVAAVLMTTALGSHSVGYYHALRTLSKPLPDGAASTAASASNSSRVLPVQALVNDFDATLHDQKPLEFVADERDSTQTIGRKLQNQLGVMMHLPIKPHSGAKLLGARRHSGWNRAGMQVHYIKDGVRVAVYQFREPGCGLSDLNEVEWNRQLFLIGQRGAYRVVVWREGDDVMTMIAPLAMREHESLLLAQDIRQTNDFA